MYPNFQEINYSKIINLQNHKIKIGHDGSEMGMELGFTKLLILTCFNAFLALYGAISP